MFNDRARYLEVFHFIWFSETRVACVGLVIEKLNKACKHVLFRLVGTVHARDDSRS